MGFTDWFTSNQDGDTGGIPWLTNFSHNVTDKAGLPDPWNQLYGDPAKKQKAALAAAAQQMHDLANQERGIQMEGLNRAMSLYDQPKAVYANLYGGTLNKAPYKGK